MRILVVGAGATGGYLVPDWRRPGWMWLFWYGRSARNS